MEEGPEAAPAERLILSFRGDVMGGQRYSDDDASCSAEGRA